MLRPSLQPLLRPLTVTLCVGLLAACASAPKQAAAPVATHQAPGTALDAALAGEWRASKDMLRDRYRHPSQTLAFFGVQPDTTVIEITPGGGWYADILAPYLSKRGQYVAAIWDDAIPNQPGYRYSSNKALREKFASNPDVYGTPHLQPFDAKAPQFGADNSADTVLTFRNVHNWVADGNAEAYFKAFYSVLKPGGVLGVVDHRAKPGTDLETMKKSGYLTEDLIIAMATDAGFVLAGRSEINANSADSKDHPNGVWTLPPSNSHDAADAAKYQAIGESDRMTLRFQKPE